MESIKTKKEAVIKDYKKVFQEDDDFDSSITSSTTSKSNISIRMKTVRLLIQTYVTDFQEKWEND
jgi:hypothetical protein